MNAKVEIPAKPFDHTVPFETVLKSEGIYASARVAGSYRVVTFYCDRTKLTVSLLMYLSGVITPFDPEDFIAVHDWVKLDESIEVAFKRN